MHINERRRTVLILNGRSLFTCRRGRLPCVVYGRARCTLDDATSRVDEGVVGGSQQQPRYRHRSDIVP